MGCQVVGCVWGSMGVRCGVSGCGVCMWVCVCEVWGVRLWVVECGCEVCVCGECEVWGSVGVRCRVSGCGVCVRECGCEVYGEYGCEVWGVRCVFVHVYVFFHIRFCYVAQAGPELSVLLLSPPPKCWDGPAAPA